MSTNLKKNNDFFSLEELENYIAILENSDYETIEEFNAIERELENLRLQVVFY